MWFWVEITYNTLMFSACIRCVCLRKLCMAGSYCRYVHTYYMCILFVFKCRVMDQDLNRIRESAKAEKSEIETLFSQYQSELDNLITTEKRLREMYAYIHNIRNYVMIIYELCISLF